MSLERRLAKLARHVRTPACTQCRDAWVCYQRVVILPDGTVQETLARPCPACGGIGTLVRVQRRVVPDAG